MNYFVTRTDLGIKVSFVVKQGNGSLRAGLVGGDFVATVINPADSASTTFAVAESAQKSGVYSFTLTSGFLGTHGVGVYPFSVEIDSFAGPSGNPNVRDSFGGNVDAKQEDVDTLADGGDGDFSRTADTLHDLRAKLNTDLDVPVSSRASQASVDAIQNVTRVAISIPPIVNPDAGTALHEVHLNMFDTAGNPEDPDENVVRTPAGDAADAIVATDRITLTNGAFTAADLNRLARVSGSGAGNDGDVIIVNVVDGQNVDVVNLDGSDPGFSGEGTGFAVSIIDQITLTLVNSAGVDRSSRLNGLVMAKIGTGRFKVIYTATAGDPIENIIFTFAYVENAIAFVQDRSTTTLNRLEDNFTAADRIVLNAIEVDTTAIEADTQDIQGRLPATLSGGRMRSQVEGMDANSLTAAALATDAAQEIRDEILDDATRFSGADIGATRSDVADIKQGTVVRTTTAIAGSSPTSIRTNLTEATGFWDGAKAVFVNAAGTVPRRISEYLITNGEILIDEPLPFTPAPGDPIIIVANHSLGQGGVG